MPLAAAKRRRTYLATAPALAYPAVNKRVTGLPAPFQELLAKFRKSLMLWPFNRPKSHPLEATIEAIYGMIVAQARLPAFYRRYQVPDTVNGRFDMVLLHLWMVLCRLKAREDAAALSQALFDRFCSDMDANLREMGVGDLSVPKRMLKFAEAFYGRTNAYDAALRAGDSTLAQALARNILLETDATRAEPLAAYVQTTLRQLAAVDDRRLAGGDFAFPDPAAEAPIGEAAS